MIETSPTPFVPPLGIAILLAALVVTPVDAQDRVRTRTGNPNGNGLPAWPAFTAGDPRVMEFDATPRPIPVPNLEQLEALDAYFAWRREQAKGRQ